MYLMRKVENVPYVMELRLCCVCCRMMCLNFNDYLWAIVDGRKYYQHVNCPPAKPERLLLGERK